MRLRLVLHCVQLALVVGLAACGDDSTPTRRDGPATVPPVVVDAPVVPEDAPLVVFLGDSLSAGLHLEAREAFPAVLQRVLIDAGTPFRLVNSGVSGSTTAAGLARTDWILKRGPEVVVIQLGANDGFRGIDLAETEKNLRAILTKVRAAGAEPLLLGMKLPPNYGADYATDFAALFERIAREEAPSYVPFFMEGVAGVPGLNHSDGIHPTAEGHRKLAENLRGPLAQLLSD